MNDGIKLTESQSRVLNSLKNFVQDHSSRVFILKGYAGTGKTTLMRYLVQYLEQEKKAYKLLAPTGRAAKVLSDMAVEHRFEGADGITIHSLIYKYSGFNREITQHELDTAQPSGQLSLMFTANTLDSDEANPTIYIVDEASMISDAPSAVVTQASFGSGRLLTELMQYDTLPGSKFIFVGDPCQLPPVGDTLSPALEEGHFNPHARSASLTEIMRQSDGNDIIRISKQVRSMIKTAPDDTSFYGNTHSWTKLPFRYSPNIRLHSDIGEMMADYVNNIKRNGYNDSVFICQRNKDATELSLHARRLLGFSGLTPNPKDLLMVIQNNHPTALVNGDMVEVLSISSQVRTRATLNFVSAKVKEVASGKEFSTLLLLDTLNSTRLNLSTDQQTALFMDFCQRMHRQGVKPKDDSFIDAMFEDPYLNALRCVYGYAVTCHKAQGGEWKNVYLHVLRNIGLNPTKQVYRWIYTAVTRAKETLHMIDDKLYLE